MSKIESTVVIERPREEVFQYFLNLDQHVAQNNPDVESFEKTSDQPTGVGTTFRSRGKALGRTRETTMRFTSIVPSDRIEFVAEVGPMRPVCSFSFDEAGAATKVTLRADPHPLGPFTLLSPLLVRIGRRVWAQRLARAKAVLEGSVS
jgi:uncharacterized protein YndB with AHSA1/START domain